jgi:hypothetical protein
MEHELLAVFVGMRPSTHLLVAAGAEGDGAHRLGFAAVKTAEPCTRGRTPTSQVMGRMVLKSRPSGRTPARIASRVTCSSTSTKTLFDLLLLFAGGDVNAVGALGSVTAGPFPDQIGEDLP